MPKHGKDERFPPVHTSTHVNQYSNSAELQHSRYRLLISNTTRKSSALGFFTCWEVIENAKGIDTMPTGYFRMSYAGRKVFVHVFVWEYHNGPKDENLDVSHLCHNKKCCRPSHLHLESRAVNKSRDNCVGVVAASPDDTPHQLCRHQPPCCTDAIVAVCADKRKEE
jgi:hypothetical protein